MGSRRGSTTLSRRIHEDESKGETRIATISRRPCTPSSPNTVGVADTTRAGNSGMGLGRFKEPRNRETVEDQRQNRRSASRQYDEETARFQYGTITDDGLPEGHTQDPVGPSRLWSATMPLTNRLNQDSCRRRRVAVSGPGLQRGRQIASSHSWRTPVWIPVVSLPSLNSVVPRRSVSDTPITRRSVCSHS